jgi:hypothetical protein
LKNAQTTIRLCREQVRRDFHFVHLCRQFVLLWKKCDTEKIVCDEEKLYNIKRVRKLTKFIRVHMKIENGHIYILQANTLKRLKKTFPTTAKLKEHVRHQQEPMKLLLSLM